MGLKKDKFGSYQICSLTLSSWDSKDALHNPLPCMSFARTLHLRLMIIAFCMAALVEDGFEERYIWKTSPSALLELFIVDVAVTFCHGYSAKSRRWDDWEMVLKNEPAMQSVARNPQPAI